MPRPASRAEALTRLRKTLEDGKIIVGAGAGIGLSAKFIEKGGADLIILYNSGRYRMHGLGSLAGLMPYGDANAIVCEMAQTVLPQVISAPVLAGVCGTDPFRDMRIFLPKLRELGFVGVQNFPTVGLIDGVFRQNLEETGMSYQKEVDMIAIAHELDFLTSPYVFSVEDGIKMTEAGADIVVVHLGLTTKGSIGAQTAVTLDDAVRTTQEIRDACVKVREDVIVLVHGGPVSDVDDVKYVLERTKGISGFYGASSLERVPVEKALEDAAKGFKTISLNL
ncbi:hypothetical protein ABW19_dt0208765 [Dactylella cylindrospora]|nr:hypothetical protein ABW19_dt0208765 [Dactylella cylindrospora]